MSHADPAYTPDLSWRGKLRRRLTRLHARRPAAAPPGPMVSFTFDDAPASSVLLGAPILEARGVRGAWYIADALDADHPHLGRLAGATEVAALRAAGHEVGGHTASHRDLAACTDAEVLDEFARNAAGLGAAPVTFAYPYGEVGFAAKWCAAHTYALSRTAAAGLVVKGSDLAQAPAVGLEGPGGEAVARRWIARAAARRAWLILFTHDVAAEPTEWGVTPDALGRTVDFALAQGLEPVTVAEGARRVGGGP